jgi:hypothetical protein
MRRDVLQRARRSVVGTWHIIAARISLGSHLIIDLYAFVALRVRTMVVAKRELCVACVSTGRSDRIWIGSIASTVVFSSIRKSRVTRFSETLAIIFSRFLADFGDLSEKLKSHEPYELNEILQYRFFTGFCINHCSPDFSVPCLFACI